MAEIIHRELFENGEVVGYEYGGELVRCKDCTRYVPFKDVDGVCLAHNKGVLIIMSQNGYCNLGEKREDDDNLISNRKCSECLHVQNITGLRKYCHDCGAIMDGENN